MKMNKWDVKTLHSCIIILHINQIDILIKKKPKTSFLLQVWGFTTCLLIVRAVFAWRMKKNNQCFKSASAQIAALFFYDFHPIVFQSTEVLLVIYDPPFRGGSFTADHAAEVYAVRVPKHWKQHNIKQLVFLMYCRKRKCLCTKVEVPEKSTSVL